MKDTKDMDDIKKMLRAVINGQSVLKSELLKRIDDVEKKLGKRIDHMKRT